MDLLNLPGEKFSFTDGKTKVEGIALVSGKLRRFLGVGLQCIASIFKSGESLTIAIRSDNEPKIYTETLQAESGNVRKIRGNKMSVQFELEGKVKWISYEDYYGENRRCMMNGYLLPHQL